MGEMAFHWDKFARGNQFVGVNDGTSIDPNHSPGLKGIGFLCHIDLGIDAFHLLGQRVLQQTVIEAISFLLPIDGIHGGVAQP